MSQSRIRVSWSPLVLALLSLTAAADTVTLIELPAPSNPVFGASKIAADGTVVGSSLVQGNIWRWPAGEAPQDLGGDTSTIENILPLIAKDGSKIVAAYNYEAGAAPAVWTGGTDWEPLPSLILTTSRPYGMSYDGSRVVGGGGNDGGTLTPWIWDAENGQQVLTLPDGVAGGQAWAVSNDGTIVAGLIAPDPSDPFTDVGARWVDGTPEYLADGDGNPLGQAVACNADCSIIVGYAGTASHQAWRWSAENGTEYLGDLFNAAPDSTYVAIDASANTKVIVGSYFAFDPDIGNVNRPFIWTPVDHLQDLIEYLANNGIEYGTGFNQLVASSVTPDGRHIVLNGMDADFVHRVAVITITPPDNIFNDGFDVTPI